MMTRLTPTLLALALLAPPALTAPAETPREVILVYSGREGTSLRGQSRPVAMEAALNHLGLIVRYHDIDAGMPDAALTRRARGVLTSFSGEKIPHAAEFARYLAEREAAGQKVVLLGNLGFLSDAVTNAPTPAPLVRRVLGGLGLSYSGDFQGDPLKVTVAERHPATDFERPWKDPLAFVGATSTDPANTVLFKLKRLDTGATSDMGVVGPHGAVVLGEDNLIYQHPFGFHLQWRIDPFWFFGHAFATEGEPRPDPTTINGRRVFYAQIDGDGFSNVADRQGRPLAAQVVSDELLAHTSLPTSVSVIAQEVVGHPAREAIARRLFARPNVEVASHSYTHPFDWEKGLAIGEGAIGDVAQDDDATDGVKKPHHAFEPRHEIDDSLTAIDRLAPPGKRVGVMLWSGRTNPTAPFLGRTEALGVPNLNGGDAIVDSRFPSVANLAPLGRQVGPYLQVYASAANENLFTNLWTGPFDGQKDALTTFTFGGAPRRLIPVDIYYHFYAGERLAGLKALQGLYAWAERQPLAPVFASRYARMVPGFYSARLTRLAPDTWAASGMGDLRTLRFDDEARDVDLERSTGVAGSHREGRTLWVHLTAPSATVVLTDRPAARPYLEEASAPLAGWRVGPRSLAAAFTADAPLTVTLAGFKPAQRLTVKGTLKGASAADARGRATFTGPRGPQRLEVSW